jgi:hypothetical protein
MNTGIKSCSLTFIAALALAAGFRPMVRSLLEHKKAALLPELEFPFAPAR